MKAQEVLRKAKELLSIDTEVEKVEMAQATLENGTVIEAESMAEGQEVFIVTEDEKVALPVGEYTLEDGTILKVEEEGIIASIGEAEAETEAPAEEELAEEEEMGYATKEELAEVKSMIEEIKAMIGEKEEMSSEEVETPAEVEEKVEELSAVEKINHNPEAKTERQINLYANKAPQTTMDRVLRQVSKFKNA
jgi:hypothetical protein